MTNSTPHERVAAGAELGVVRTMTTVLAAATLFFLALSIGQFFDQSAYTVAPWQTVTGIAIFASPLIIAAVAPWRSLRQLRILHGAYAIVFAVSVLSWLLAFVNGPMPAGTAPWVVGMTALGTVPAAIAWRPAAAWGLLVADSLMIIPIRILSDGGADVALAIEFAFFTVAVCAVFTATAIVAIGAGRKVDVATNAARASAMRAAALTARGEEQARLDALIHDEVIATIFAAAGAGRSDSSTTRLQAARTIAHLTELREAGPPAPELIQVDYLTQGLATSVKETTDAAVMLVSGTRTTPVPSVVASALLEATIEALRNSVLHASPDSSAVRREVRLELSPSHLEITIADDGRGFDPQLVPANRLGIVVSILGRINALSDAHASVWSQPGSGTLVTIGWSG